MPAHPSSSLRRTPRTTRSVSGCLTCRRRRVKCSPSGKASASCGPCRRLELSCEPSFHQNFKTWTAESPGPAASPTAAPTGGDRPEPEGSSQQAAALPATDPAAVPGSSDASDPFNALDYIFSDLVVEMLPDASASDLADLNAWFTLPLGEENVALNAPAPASFSQLQQEPWTVDASTNQDLDLHRVPELLSSKQSIWTCFHYLVKSAKAIPNSPLCCSILAWLYAFLSRRSASSSSYALLCAENYKAASDTVEGMVRAMTSGTSPCSSWTTDQLSLYYSCTFFLCQCDLILGSAADFSNRLEVTKGIFKQHWAERIMPGTV